MLKITSEEFHHNISLYQDLACKEAVMISSNERKPLVLINVDEYKQLKKRARIVMKIGELSDSVIQHIQSTTMSEDKNILNTEITKPKS